jgi:hypothetical protein
MKRRFALLAPLFAFALLCAPSRVVAQNNWPTPGGAGAGGAVIMCLNASGQAIPATAAGTCLGAGGATTADPCSGAKSFATISQTTSTQVITGTAAKKTYVCSYFWSGADAENISLVEGTGSVCATNIYALVGSTTAGAGNNFTAGSGVAQGNGGGTVAFGSADANATAANVCLLQSGSGRVAGVIGYVQQ